jgi:hypothetical protein
MVSDPVLGIVTTLALVQETEEETNALDALKYARVFAVPAGMPFATHWRAPPVVQLRT